MGWGRLLELVDHQVLEALRDPQAGVGALREQAVQGQEDVAAIEAAALGEDPVVARVELGELDLSSHGLPGGLVGSALLPVASALLQPRRPDPFGLQRIDPSEQAGQERGGVAADLVAAQRQLVEAVEEHRQPLRRAQHVEEGVEAGRLGVLAQEPLADRLPAADPELLERAVQERLGSFSQPPRGRPGRADHEHLLRWQSPLRRAGPSVSPAARSCRSRPRPTPAEGPRRERPRCPVCPPPARPCLAPGASPNASAT